LNNFKILVYSLKELYRSINQSIILSKLIQQ